MIDTIYLWILFVLVCIIAIAPAMIFYIAFFNDENDDAGDASYLMALSALLLGLVPVVGGNVLPIDILSLSFWIAEGIIGVTLFLIFIFHVKRTPHYLFSTLLTLGISSRYRLRWSEYSNPVISAASCNSRRYNP